jgi:hypothetical protein
MLLAMRNIGAMLCSALLLVGAALMPATCNEAPTWQRDVAPIVSKSCSSCHRDGGAAFALSSYADARAHGIGIDHMVTTQKMPPWPPERDGCPTFVGDRRLSAAEIELVSRWTESGMPEGAPTGSALPTPPPFGELEGINDELTIDDDYSPSTDSDDYRCFVLDPKRSEDAFITAYRMKAGPGIHHVQLWEIDDAEGATKIARVDDEAPGPGFPCTVWPDVPVRVLSVWGPSDPVRRHPAGTGIRVRADHKLVLQVHYHHASGPSRPGIGLVLADSVAEEATLLGIGSPWFVLPPRTPATNVHVEWPVDADMKLWGVRAHMHTLGSMAHIARKTPLESSCLLSIPSWDANWQLMYFYENPIALKVGDKLELDCTYDTMTQNEAVHTGITGQDEMCNGYFYVTGIPPR